MVPSAKSSIFSGTERTNNTLGSEKGESPGFDAGTKAAPTRQVIPKSRQTRASFGSVYPVRGSSEGELKGKPGIRIPGLGVVSCLARALEFSGSFAGFSDNHATVAFMALAFGV